MNFLYLCIIEFWADSPLGAEVREADFNKTNHKKRCFFSMLAMKVVYFANVLVAGWISISSLFFPKIAHHTVFNSMFEYSEVIRLVGALWGAIFLISILGLFYPRQMSLVLLFQLIYKGSWLLFAALPAMLRSQPYPREMAMFFVVWVIVLPFVIPWKALFL